MTKIYTMKSYCAWLVTLLLVVLFANSEAVRLNLAGLRPDLEYLREFWLKNPREYYRPGRIIFSNNYELVVTFAVSPRLQEECSSNPVYQWTTETLRFRNINCLFSNTSTLSFSSLLYNHGTFYIHENSCDLPQVVEDDQFDLDIPPISILNDERNSVQVLYTDLKTLGYDIEREISKIDGELNKRLLKVRRQKPERRSGEGFFVNSAESGFSVEYEKGSRHVKVPHVRVLETSFESASPIYVNGRRMSPLRELPERHVSFLVSTDYCFVRYDRVTRLFITPESDLLDDHWFVRSSVGDYVLKDGVKFRGTGIPARPRISYSKMARSTVRVLAPLVKVGARELMRAMTNGQLNLQFNNARGAELSLRREPNWRVGRVTLQYKNKDANAELSLGEPTET